MRYLVTVLVAWLVMIIPEPLSAASQYQWKYRPLFIFADSAVNPALIEQRRIVAAGRAGLVERQVVVIWVVGGSVSADAGPGPRQTAAKLRAQYGVGASNFKAILVGKDGGVKLVTPSPIRTEALFKSIDAMPMRRDEIRR